MIYYILLTSFIFNVWAVNEIRKTACEYLCGLVDEWKNRKCAKILGMTPDEYELHKHLPNKAEKGRDE